MVSMSHFLLQTGADQALMEEATLSLGVQFKVAIHSVANANGPLSGLWPYFAVASNSKSTSPAPAAPTLLIVQLPREMIIPAILSSRMRLP